MWCDADCGADCDADCALLVNYGLQGVNYLDDQSIDRLSTSKAVRVRERVRG